jgi:hypothetical protein
MELYSYTEEERSKIIKNFFKIENNQEKLVNLPRQNKKKFIVLQHIAERFTPGKTYREKEVNEKLMEIYVDYVTLRRALIDYRLLKREKNCSSYWVSQL